MKSEPSPFMTLRKAYSRERETGSRTQDGETLRLLSPSADAMSHAYGLFDPAAAPISVSDGSNRLGLAARRIHDFQLVARLASS
jgi:hypothetical protein